VSLFQRDWDWDCHCRKESRLSMGFFLHKAWVRGARERIDSCVFNAKCKIHLFFSLCV
jgi:hypothetical protein